MHHVTTTITLLVGLSFVLTSAFALGLGAWETYRDRDALESSILLGGGLMFGWGGAIILFGGSAL